MSIFLTFDIFVLTMASYMKGKIEIIIPNYTFLPANSKHRQIWNFLKTNASRLGLLMPEPRLKLLLIVTHPYSVMFDGCTVITALMKQLENNLQVTMGCWKFNFLHYVLNIFLFHYLAAMISLIYCKIRYLYLPILYIWLAIWFI